jgi:hypothetical protein
VRNRSLVSLAALAFSASPLLAQNSPQMSPAAAFPQWRSFIGANPLGIPFDIVSVEAETAVGLGGTVGFVGSYNDFDDKRYTTCDLRGTYYPGEVAMRGFAVGMSLGTTKFNAEDFNACDLNGCQRIQMRAGTLGVLVDYNWTQGPSQRFVIGTGIGAKRILASQDKRDALRLERAYVTGRFVIGLLF